MSLKKNVTVYRSVAAYGEPRSLCERGVSAFQSTEESGTIIEIKDYVRVKTSNGFIDIYKIQPENKKILNVKDWVNGARVKIGDKFE